MDLMWDIASPQSTLSLFYLLQKKKEIMQNRKISKILRKTSIVKFFLSCNFFFTNYVVGFDDPIIYRGISNLLTKTTKLQKTRNPIV